MNILILGSGGREHAIAWKLSQSPDVERIYIAPGNGGTLSTPKCSNISVSGYSELADFAATSSVDMVVIGPEAPLVEGAADIFRERGLSVIGPDKDAARLEGSKSFAKEFMGKYGIRTAEYREFREYHSAREYLSEVRLPVVVKADGLAAGKGVIICFTRDEAFGALDRIMKARAFGEAGDVVVVEEFLEGREASVLAMVDGETILPMLSAKDHKQIGEGDTGPNTGGMGVVAPNPYFTESVNEDFTRNILEPTLKGIRAENWDYRGVMFFGLMITSSGVYLLEYNVRMGDPETQAVLPLMENDLAELFRKTDERALSGCSLSFSDRFACNVVAASGGYPGEYEKGFVISGVDKAVHPVFISGAVMNDGNLVTSSGRVLSLTAVAPDLAAASIEAYSGLSGLKFRGMQYRRDIGK